MKSLAIGHTIHAVALIILLILVNFAIDSAQSDAMAVCQLSHSFDVCHSTLNR